MGTLIRYVVYVRNADQIVRLAVIDAASIREARKQACRYAYPSGAYLRNVTAGCECGRIWRTTVAKHYEWMYSTANGRKGKIFKRGEQQPVGYLPD